MRSVTYHHVWPSSNLRLQSRWREYMTIMGSKLGSQQQASSNGDDQKPGINNVASAGGLKAGDFVRLRSNPTWTPRWVCAVVKVGADFERGAEVYWTSDRNGRGELVKKKRYVCCTKVENGNRYYRLKDEPPPSKIYSTDWILEGQLADWK